MILGEGRTSWWRTGPCFEGDQARFFVGRVEAHEAGVVRASGHTCALDPGPGQVVGTGEPRTKLLSLSSGTLIVYVLPEWSDPDVAALVSQRGRVVLTDGEQVLLHLAQFSHGGRFRARGTNPSRPRPAFA
jgi:hypothetical protein